MDQVEALCRTVFLIHKGRGILSGAVREVKERHADNAVLIEASVDVAAHPMVERAQPNGHSMKVWLKADVTPEAFVSRLIQDGATLRHFERALPSMDEIFVKVVKD
jgi:ABC-2 type transport system ATP-binding protein